MQPGRLVLLVTACLTMTLQSASAAKENAQDMKDSLHDALQALERALVYLNGHVDNINLDAVIGTRFVDGQLQVIVRKYAETTGRYPRYKGILSKLEYLQTAAEIISDNALDFIRVQDPVYYSKLHTLVEPGFWQLDMEVRPVDRLLMQQGGRPEAGEVMSEEDSDNCVAELLGTNKEGLKCAITLDCWLLMTGNGYSGYSLSHQVFYIEIGVLAGCSTEMSRLANELNASDLEKLSSEFCANMLAESEAIAEAQFPQNKQDIFMEQGALCGMLGFQDFFKPEWLRKVLSWQDANGCYKNTTAPYAGNNEVGRIAKREEKIIADGCLSHKTAVATGVLVEYIHFLTDRILKDYGLRF